MIKNYLKTAWRNLIKNKTFSLINIFGLSIGMAVCFMILMYVRDELSYDRYNNHADQIVRVVFNANMNGGKIDESGVMAPVAQTMKKDYPEVLAATRILRNGVSKISYKDKVFKDDEIAFVDPNFFKVFTLPFISGDAQNALLQPNTVVISKTVAEKYFGKEDAINKTLGVNNNSQFYKVTGVIKDMPDNSHFHFGIFVSMAGVEPAKSDSWMYGSFYTYLLLKDGTDYRKLQSKLPSMVERYMGPQIQRDMGMSLAQFRTKGNELGFSLEPLPYIHLHPYTINEFEGGGNETYVYIFGAIAIFMLLIACINFINLSTASASKRAKEVGVRKVIGSGRIRLIIQFLIESALLVAIALIISFTIIKLSLPTFNMIAGKNLSLGFSANVVGGFIALGALVSIIAGIYPALFLSAFKPITVLKGRLGGNNKRFGLRSGLVIFQFFISVGLIISTIVVYQQMNFIQNKKLGYDKEQLLIIPNSYLLGKNEQSYKQTLLHDPRVVNVTLSGYKPAGPTDNNNAMAYPQGHDDLTMRTLEYHVDDQYIATLGMKIAVGRNFSNNIASDSTGLIINETAARAFGWNMPDAIGKIIIRVNSDRGTNVPYHVVGVVKDFNFRSLHEPVTPLLMNLSNQSGLIVKVKTTDIQGLISTMRKQWDGYQTDEPFTYSFMDDLYNKTYAAEQKTGTLLNIFSVLTIFVACLGLFGLATYTAEQRTKEIGVRKVLGASVSQVAKMLSKDFIKLVFIACLVAFPLSYWAMHQWLLSFAYRIDISWWVFVAAAFSSLLIALCTVSFQAIKAAVANPVKSLKSE
jgi:putative ABC transport system permease protein